MPANDLQDLPADRRRRARLVETALAGFTERTREAMAAVPRHWFMDDRAFAYADTAMPIGSGQTISQPYVIAAMLDALAPAPGEAVLDVGSGSGYVSALLARLVGPEGVVYALERHRALVEASRRPLAAVAGDETAPVILACADAFAGLAERAPFDGIHVGCAAVDTPPALLEQLAPGGRLVLPTGRAGAQDLWLHELGENGCTARTHLLAVRFVPMLPGTEG